ncbi:unnamed protein product [Rhizoctonia solani]|uniref:O-methylsterigmatocystin oxidoreductase n=1 Tax=Rhizoctonia solani TaxID=456999 RepID=A0A8H3HSP5_9AGAM|nr:unnamed protein product [Rhizoctonia solani]
MLEVPNTGATRLAGLLAVGTVAVVLGKYWDWPGSRRKDMPPGPAPWPIFGNLLQLKLVDSITQFRELNERYGPLVSLKLGSGRPLDLVSEIAGDGDHGLFQQDADKWRAGKKQIANHYNPRTVKTKHVRMQEAESVQLLYDFLRKPEEHMHHYYGVRCPTYDDLAVREMEEIMDSIGEMRTPGAKPPVEQFPWLWYLPGFMNGNWKAKSKFLGERLDKCYGTLAEIGWERGVNGYNTDNLAYNLRLNEASHGMTRHQQILTCGIVLEGATDVVAGVISACILALIHDPDIQRRAREEIDGLYDEDTLPKWEDEQKLPLSSRKLYDGALPSQSAFLIDLNKARSYDQYERHFIPKDTTVVCNIWAIHSNPERYEDPELFKPDRFLGHTLSMVESKTQADPYKRDHFAFGAGRRSCPGVQLAEQDIFIAISRLLWAFELSAPQKTRVNVGRDAFTSGPVRIPILGNLSLLQIKRLTIFDQLQELNRKYGPLVSLKLGSSNIIVIGGDGSLVRELLDKRGSIYSNRPFEPSQEITGAGDNVLFQRNTEKWKAARRQIVRHYPRASDPEQVHLQEAESVQLLYDFLHQPEHNMKHPMRYTTSIITCLNYGIRCATYDDPIVHDMEIIMTFVPRPPVEHFPLLWYLPDFMVGNWRFRLERRRELIEKVYGGLAEVGWERGRSGMNTDNLAYKLRLNEGVTQLTRSHQAQICGIALEGGSDIVAGVISTIILALLEDTQSQERARQEIDAIYDEDTLPRWEDEQRMPFVRAIIKEALRWRPPLPICVAHRLEQGKCLK